MTSQSTDDEKAWWTADSEREFINLLYDHKLKGESHGTISKKHVWRSIEIELYEKTKKKIPLKKLKAKYYRLRAKHQEFIDLLAHTGFGWDPETNTVKAEAAIWEEYLKHRPAAKPFRKAGLEHYELLGQIFNVSTATGGMNYSSKEMPLSSDEDRSAEKNFPNSRVDADLDDVDADVHTQVQKGKKPRRSTVPSSEHPSSKGGNPQMKDSMDMYSEVVSYKVIRAKEKSMSSSHDPSSPSHSPHVESFSVAECVKVAMAMHLETSQFTKLMKVIPTKEFREMFLTMDDDYRRKWIDSL